MAPWACRLAGLVHNEAALQQAEVVQIICTHSASQPRRDTDETQGCGGFMQSLVHVHVHEWLSQGPIVAVRDAGPKAYF